MPSEHGDRFVHDDQADAYDRNVQRGSDPFRAGYSAVLDWIAAQTVGRKRILELGGGTGNLTLRLPPSAAITSVDLSSRMLDHARTKLSGREVSFVQQDLLDYTLQTDRAWDAVVSTYAVHHLETAEKKRLLTALAELVPDGVMAFGDLMFADEQARERVLTELPEVREAVEDEFFWDVAESVGWLEELGLRVEVRRFSALSWGICARP